MQERTYIARRFDEAVTRVKRDLGDDAIILSSRTVPTPDGTTVEVVAAPAETAPSEAGGARWDHGFEGRLVRKGVPASVARAVVARLPRGVGRAGGRAPTAAELAAALSAALPWAPPPASRVTAFVGPTGVGKTTTIAKLAAIAALVEGERVALVSIDQFRIGATEQLERYADLIGVPLDVAYDASSLAMSLQRCGAADRVFVDTAGRSPKDEGALREMAETLQGAGEPVAVHLCLPAGMRQSELQHAVDRHAPLRPSALVATKIDEALYYGSVVAAVASARLPLLHFTNGQRVPEDLERASPEGLATLLLGREMHE